MGGAHPGSSGSWSFSAIGRRLLPGVSITSLQPSVCTTLTPQPHKALRRVVGLLREPL